MPDTIITKHKSWEYLLRDLTCRDEFKKLANLTQRDMQLGLIIPVTIAKWLIEQHPDLLDRDALHIVLAGAEWGADHPDDGSWYQLIPTLLGRPNLRIAISAVGPNVFATTRTGVLPGGEYLHSKPLRIDTTGVIRELTAATFSNMTLGAYVRQTEAKIDAVFMPHPGFELYTNAWLSSSELNCILAAGIPVGVCSYSGDEYTHEIWILNTYGYKHFGAPIINPFALEDEGSELPSALAHTIWGIAPSTQDIGFEPNHVEIAMLSSYSSWLNALYEEGYLEDGKLSIGDLIRDENASEIRRIFIPPRWAASPRDGSVYEMKSDGRTYQLDYALPTELIAQYQENPDFQFKKRIWALKAFGYIEQFLRIN